jgi:lysozyme
MIAAFALQHARIHISGSSGSARRRTECRQFNPVSKMLLTTGKTSAVHTLLAFLLLPTCALAANSVVNMSHYDSMRPDFAGMAREGVAGVIHEATFPRRERDAKYSGRQRAALEAGLLWGAYHFGDATNPVRQADHFLDAVRSALPSRLADPGAPRSGVLLVLDFEKNGHYPGGSMSVAQAVAFVEHIKKRTGKYPGLYCSEYRLRQMLYGRGASASHRRILTNCWLWIANYHAEPRNTAPWDAWHMWQYTGDGKCDLRPRSMYPKSVANVRKAERNIFRGDNVTLQAFWRKNAWYPSG